MIRHDMSTCKEETDRFARSSSSVVFGSERYAIEEDYIQSLLHWQPVREIETYLFIRGRTLIATLMLSSIFFEKRTSKMFRRSPEILKWLLLFFSVLIGSLFLTSFSRPLVSTLHHVFLIGLPSKPIITFLLSYTCNLVPRGFSVGALNCCQITNMAGVLKCKLLNYFCYFVGKLEDFICYGITISL